MVPEGAVGRAATCPRKGRKLQGGQQESFSRHIGSDLRAGDQAVGVSDVEVGTMVIGQIDPHTTRSTREAFGEYSEDFRFVRTRPVVKLFGLGLRFVSRSQARRLVTGLDEFTEIDVDFAGVEDVGQAFVDELLRVWPQEHPGRRSTRST